MKQRHSLLLLLLLLLNVAACSPGHTGDNIIAFLRAGQFWTIDPSGANAFAIVSAGMPPVVGYTWSPNHRIVAFRQLDSTFANTSSARHLTSQPVTGLIADTPSTLNTVGVDGGTPISIALSSPDVPYNNPFWINNGTRLLYRQTSITTQPQGPEDATWWVSQNDQPAGIAAKNLPPLLSLPSVDENNQRIAGSSHEGILTTTLTGTDIQYRIHTPLEGHPLAASLERVLWQPGSAQSPLLYAVSSTKATSKTSQVTLQLQQQNGLITPLLSCACTQFAWSPNGQMLLYSTGNSFTVFSLHDKSSYTIQAEQSSVPYWSPDSRFLLLDGLQSLHLIQPTQHQDRVILNTSQQVDSNKKNNDAGSLLPASNALLQPVPNSNWASDSRHFLFTTNHRLYWQGQQLAKGEGLYTVAVDQDGQIQGQPIFVTGGSVTQAGWTYQDPTSSFLY